MKILKNKKIIILTIISLICVTTFIPNFAYAADLPSLGDIFTYAHDFESADAPAMDMIDSGTFDSTVKTVYDILITVAICVAFLVGVVLGAKYISGTIEEKAQVKKTLFAYLIGCAVVFGAFGIWRLVLNVLQT